jgi:lipopolysaccharide biosynthesis regulator YciM
MSKIILLALLFLFVGCSQKSPQPDQKAFEQEDTYIIFALHAEQMGDYKSAAKLFETLYKKSGNKEYLYRYLNDTMKVGAYTAVIKSVDANSVTSSFDAKLVRFKVKALIGLNRLDAASKLALVLAKKSNKPADYILLSDIYTQQKKYNLALKYLEGAYVKNYNEAILDKMAVILYVNLHKKSEAIAYLESHARMQGCSKRICGRLASFYSYDNNIDGLLSIYKRLYAKYKSDALAEKIIEIYSYKKEYVKLMDFLEANPVDNRLLLELYLSAKDYKKASDLAYKLYKSEDDYVYLGQSAIYNYESYKGKIPKSALQKVVKELSEVLKYNKDTLYLNYLGYILIDHDIDVKKGVSYIREALKKEPNSAYYLDSLAWGYYKLGWCFKANKIMKKVVDLGVGDEPEVKEHITKIKRCMKHKRNKKR